MKHNNLVALLIIALIAISKHKVLSLKCYTCDDGISQIAVCPNQIDFNYAVDCALFGSDYNTCSVN